MKWRHVKNLKLTVLFMTGMLIFTAASQVFAADINTPQTTTVNTAGGDVAIHVTSPDNTITTSGINSRGIDAAAGTVSIVNDGSDVLVINNSQPTSATDLTAEAGAIHTMTGATVNSGVNLDITENYGLQTGGIHTHGGSVNVSGDVKINADGGYDNGGIRIGQYGKVAIDGDLEVQTNTNSSDPIDASEGSLSVGGNAKLTSYSTNSAGIYLRTDDTYITIGGNAEINCSEKGSDAIYTNNLYGADDTSKEVVTVLGSLNANIAGTDANGIVNIFGTVNTGGVSMDIKQGCGIYTLAGSTTNISLDVEGANKINAGQIGICTYGAGANTNICKGNGEQTLIINSVEKGISATDNASVSSDAKLKITAANGGLYAASGGSVTTAAADITTIGAGADAILVDGSANGTASNVTVKNGGVIAAEGTDSAALHAQNGGVINVSGVAASAAASNIAVKGNGDGTVNASGSTLNGDIVQSQYKGIDGALTVNLNDGSKLTGTANSAVSTSKIDLNIDPTSKWNITGNSQTYGALNNNGTVDFGNTTFSHVSVSDYVGGPGSVIRTKINIDDNSTAATDQIIVSDTATGTSALVIKNMANAGHEYSLPIIKASSGRIILTPANSDEVDANGIGYIHAGAWKYSLVKQTGADGSEQWLLARSEEPTSTGYGIAAAGFQSDVWYTETNTLFRRLGIYRDGEWQGGLWFEGAANKEDFKLENTDNWTDNRTFKTGTIGYDKRIDTDNAAYWYGAMIGYGKADNDLSYSIGDYDLKSFHASIYGIMRNENGAYAAGIFKYNRYKTELNIDRPDNFSRYTLGFDKVTGDWEQDGYGVSLQAGRRFDIGENGWYVEPQAQFSVNHVCGESYVTNSGIDVDINAVDYIRLRGGFVLGRKFALNNGTQLDVYADASIIYDFDGKGVMYISGGKYESDLGGAWGIYGAGINWTYGKGKYMNLRFQYSDGHPFEEPWAVYFGLGFEM